MWTHQILHHAHPLTAQFSHQPVDVHKVVISDVLNEVVESNKHACSAHTSTEDQRESNVPLYCLLLLHFIPYLWGKHQRNTGTPFIDGLIRAEVPAVDHYCGVVVPVGPDGFDKLNESAAGLWDSVLRPWCVVEVANQNVVPVLQRGIYARKRTVN